MLWPSHVGETRYLSWCVFLDKQKFFLLLGIDVGREKERDGCGSNEGIFRYKYAVGGGTKSS